MDREILVSLDLRGAPAFVGRLWCQTRRGRQLPRLLASADRVTGNTEGDEDLRLLLGPGSSLGGARPKVA